MGPNVIGLFGGDTKPSGLCDVVDPGESLMSRMERLGSLWTQVGGQLAGEGL